MAGNLRVTQQYVSVLGRATGGLRATQVYVSVLGPSHTASQYEVGASSAITLDVAASSPIKSAQATSPISLSNQTRSTSLEVSASNALTLQSAAKPSIRFLNAINSVFLNGFGQASHLTVSATSSLTLSQFLDTPLLSRTLISALSLGQSAVGEGPRIAQAVSSLSLSQSARRPNQTAIATNQLLLIDAMHLAQELADTPFSILALDQSTSGWTGQVQAVSGLTLGQLTDMQIKSRSLAAAIAVAQSAVAELVPADPKSAQNGLTLAVAAAAFRVLVTRNEISLNQSVTLNFSRLLTASNAIQTSQSFTYETNRLSDKQYNPQTGDGSPINPIAPTLERRHDVELYYPDLGTKVYSILLKTPEFGNLDRNAYTRINRESRGGSLTVFSDPKWPKTRSLLLSFVGVKDSEKSALKTLLRETIGVRIGFRDWEGRVWTGIVLNPDTPFTKNRRFGFDISLELMAELSD